MEFSADAIFGRTLDGLITSWNKGAEKIYGYAEYEVIGQPVSILVPVDLQDEAPEILGRVAQGEFISHYETVRRRKDGEEGTSLSGHSIAHPVLFTSLIWTMSLNPSAEPPPSAILLTWP